MADLATTFPPADERATPKELPLAGTPFEGEQRHADAPPSIDFPSAIPQPTPTGDAPTGTPLAPDQAACATQRSTVGGNTLLDDHRAPDAHTRSVVERYGGADALLLAHADALDDLERVRIASQGRLRALRGVKRSSGLPAERATAILVEDLLALEHRAALDLRRSLRAHPLGPWVKAQKGVGEKQAARLLAAIGDPADRPNPAKLWQFCGHGDPARSRARKGQPVQHSPTAKMRVRMVAESCMKQRESPYRAIYDRERAKWVDRDTTDGHRHAHALRVVGKSVLLDLWREARRLRHGLGPVQPPSEPARSIRP